MLQHPSSLELRWLRRISAVVFTVLVLILIILTALRAVADEVQPVTGRWHDDFAEASAEAKRLNKPLLVHFFADWCLPCEELDKRTFSDPTVREVAGRFLMIKADLTRYGSPGTERLKKRYNIKGVPTVIFIDADGHVHVTGGKP